MTYLLLECHLASLSLLICFFQLLFTTATYDETPFNTVVGEILRDNSMLSSRADPRVPLVFAISSKMSSSPTQICLFRNYNYGGGEMRDSFVQDPIEAKKELEIDLQDDIFKMSGLLCYDGIPDTINKTAGGSRHPGKYNSNASRITWRHSSKYNSLTGYFSLFL